MIKIRIVSCFKGLAIGDAIGKQTEMLSRNDIAQWYPDGVRGFEGPPGSVIPRYVGNSKREWRVGETTDDTERTIAVARAIIRDRDVSHTSVGEEMLGCTKSVHAGVKSLWEFHQAGDPARIAANHDGCGAAIRVAPVGVFYGSDKLRQIVTGAYEAAIPTHGGSRAIAAASATAAAVSAGIDGASQPEIMGLALEAAAQAEARWPGPSGPSFTDVTRSLYEDLRSWDSLDAEDVAQKYFPRDSLTIVPLAIGLGTVMQSATDAVLLSTNIGGDSDSVASIAGGILGAVYPGTVNEEWFRVVETINRHGLVSIAEELAELRN